MLGKSSRRWPVRETWIAVGALLAGLLVSQAFAVEPPVSRKMVRQIDVMQRIVDQVLLDSPNFLVSGRENTRGIYIADYGVVFTFSASLVNKGQSWKFDFGEGFKVLTEDGKRVIVIEPGQEDPEADAEADKESDSSDNRLSRTDRAQERLYKRGKAELVDVFLDYGDTMTALDKGQWVTIVAFLGDASFFAEARISRLVLKAKIDDLRAYASEKISEKEMVGRIVEEEY